ncbi:MAG TPA: 1-(5-phosphoribosyl)-5-[(5-phosphoribosylamino)methylideneamino]imidazole-4-carboxamide isomerase [Gemmataceae bacterium]|jgi:phosphoribosylformimino-5-aminoimidazole carboxamide ribotide isomerase|nr:1-(5-phosphoribosyl)-5-[(5-phosphoribosylamino)methylideneamino]imidazole-4-carboxamide isomerase [Gemmataceae bacterium]
MLILPAIDLRGGQCVRLRQGDYSQETVFGSDAAVVAREWVRQGARALHIVDLDGAREGRPVNITQIQAIVRSIDVPCQLGGGLRSREDIEQALAWGVRKVILGTRALKDSAWFEEIVREFPERIVLGLDARQGLVATNGWLEVDQTPALEVARRCAALPLAALVYTDISRDGMLEGANVEVMAELASAIKVPLIASGGVTNLEDVRKLARLGLAGCIIGRALYEGCIDLGSAIRVAQEAG